MQSRNQHDLSTNFISCWALSI